MMENPTTNSKNLGTVSAIHVGGTAPSNNYQMWIDNSATPYKRKFWDTLTQQWLEVAFIATQASLLKRMNTRFGGSNALTLNDDVYVMNVDGGNEVLILLAPSSSSLGISFNICNYSNAALTFSVGIRTNNVDILFNQPSYSSWEITVAETSMNIFEYCLIKSSIL